MRCIQKSALPPVIVDGAFVLAPIITSCPATKEISAPSVKSPLLLSGIALIETYCVYILAIVLIEIKSCAVLIGVMSPETILI